MRSGGADVLRRFLLSCIEETLAGKAAAREELGRLHQRHLRIAILGKFTWQVFVSGGGSELSPRAAERGQHPRAYVGYSFSESLPSSRSCKFPALPDAHNTCGTRTAYSQAVRRPIEWLAQHFFCLRLRLECVAFLQRHASQHRPGPGAKILGGKVVAADLAQIIVHIREVDGVGLAVVADILEQFIAGEVLASPNNLGQSAVLEYHPRGAPRSFPET